MTDLDALLQAVFENPGDRTSLNIFADWIDENYPATPVVVGKLPKGFHRFWHSTGLNRRFRAANSIAGHAFASANWEIQMMIQRAASGWWDHAGSSEIAGHRVLVSEIYGGRERAIEAAIQVQATLVCPVTFANRAAWNPGCSRITVWFDHPARLARVAS